MRLRLTDLAIKKLALPTSGQQTYWDEATPGFGLRCSTRSKSFVIMYGPKRRLRTLGRYPELSLADARKQARVATGDILRNGDTARSFDYNAVLQEYLADCEKRLRTSTLDGYQLYLSSIPFSGPIDKVGRRDVLRAIEAYTTSPSSQNYAFTTFKVFFNWLVRQQYLSSNPLGSDNRPNASSTRQRTLSQEEVRTLLKFTGANRGRFHDIVSLLLLTGQRRGEIAALQWSEIDGDLLIFAADRTKNKHGHEVPLSSLAIELLNSIEGGATHVFGDQEVDQPYNGWSRAQRRLITETEIDHFTLHDLRRTFATFHAQIGTPLHVTERMLNHRSGSISGVAAVYNRHSYLEEMRDAMTRYDKFLANLLDKE
ncbi:tyrosine-type recombinase/integrase [Aliiruegeria lutimaris]|uniref:Site-specific recombinase XerD n=1 Tax=Aliiruegeria lutimaris TaxID=571298 RepID=A0A1G9F766_9RHOB|nr:tyrosine-type recombinase/integrase [Aliiruegeria lutimaris]SDK84228.1 Site-specific recombinase XerD [Aliiruegeria lutimaris]